MPEEGAVVVTPLRICEHEVNTFVASVNVGMTTTKTSSANVATATPKVVVVTEEEEREEGQRAMPMEKPSRFNNFSSNSLQIEATKFPRQLFLTTLPPPSPSLPPVLQQSAIGTKDLSGHGA